MCEWDAVLLDYEMPMASGYELCSRTGEAQKQERLRLEGRR
jgi:CheY-like chemotaxis protein